MNQRRLNSILAVSALIAVVHLTLHRGTELQDGNKNLPSVTTYEDVLGVPMDNPQLIDYIRKEILIPPSKKPYNLTQPERHHFSQFDQSTIVDSLLLKGKKNGFFVEVGAVNGEYLSNSLYFERDLGWTGLLIEPNPITYGDLKWKGRKAYSANCALSLNQSSSNMKLRIRGAQGVVSVLKDANHDKGVTVKTLPLYSLLLALNVSVIDYFSLDVEGTEMKVLESLPWDKLTIHVLEIEINHFPEGMHYLISYLELRGYKYLGIKMIDAYFVSPDVWNNILKKVNPFK